MRALKTRWFHRWASREGLTDSALFTSLQEIERGLIDAHLGGYLIKKRVAVGSHGKRGGARMVLAYGRADIAFFIYGFTKNERASIGPKSLKSLQRLAVKLLSYDEAALLVAMKAGEFIEVIEQ